MPRPVRSRRCGAPHPAYLVMNRREHQMSHGKTGRSTLGPSIFAIALLISSQVLFAAPLWHSKTTPTALGPGSVAIVPFVFYGKVDQELTNSFLEQLTSLKTTSRIVDDTSFASH